MLKSIFIVTMLVMNVPAVEQAWQRDLRYRTVAAGVVGTSEAAAWGAPAMAGSRFALMQPESGREVYIRLVQAAEAAGWRPMATEGWNAVELLVQDPEVLARRLAYSRDFTIVGEPRFLTDQHNILALQATGPANELLYLTRINDPSKSVFDLGFAESWVDRVFIMVVGGRDLRLLRDFYGNTLGMPVSEPLEYRIAVLSQHYGLPEEHLHRLAVAQLPGQFLLEMDEYPQAVQPRAALPGRLPPGVAMVSFQVDDLPADTLPLRGPPRRLDAPPYNGAMSATLVGPAGEVVELVTPAPP